MKQEYMAQKPPFDILVAGEINPDLILSGNVEPTFSQVEKLVDSATLTVGSSSAIFACGAARLGLRVTFIGVCSDDSFGNYMLAEMNARDVDTSSVLVRPGGQTGLSVFLNRGADRAILTFPGLMATLTAADVTDTLLRRSRHLHVASYFLQTALQPGLPELFTRAHALGLSTSLDTNWDPSGKWQNFDVLLQQVDVFLPNENEALALTNTKEVKSASQSLSEICPVVAIKLGADGALARRNREIAHVPALKVHLVDTVGAGDTFDAGFLYGYLNGWELENSLHMAVACGSLSTSRVGGIAAQPTLEEALEYVPPIR
ncbi:MAG: carbohydrate kinase [Chloroflexi bacterium RBG_19FT_COMBO_49_13]|nr:MAG: carbohydrate kinase [Chloroflexi bacterium RBG_19FT_COMBO_49_13]